MDKVRLGDTEYYIKKNGTGDFSLVWESKTQIKKASPRTGKVSGKPLSNSWYYGSLYQALIGFYKFYTEGFKGEVSIEEIEERADAAYKITCSIMDKLSDIDKAIMEEWKIVKVTNG